MASGALPARPSFLRVVSPEEMIQAETEQNLAFVANERAKVDLAQWNTNIVGFIDGEFTRFQRHRDSANGWTERIQNAMRVFKGEYEPGQLAAIRRFGGSEIYARIIATKCRGASSLLRDIYLNVDRPWALRPTPDPTLPDDQLAAITQLVEVEVANMTMAGQTPDQARISERIQQLVVATKRAAQKRARNEADTAEDKLDDLLVEGKFYEALAQFITDLPLFPFACIKGPVVEMVPQVTWRDGKAVEEVVAKMYWYRVSPYDIWWTPGVADITMANVIERKRVTRQMLNRLIGLPGYNEAAIRSVLTDYGRGGIVSNTIDTSDTSRAALESREDPRMNESGMIDLLEFHGYVQGRLLLDQGLPSDQVDDPDKDYFIQAFKVGKYLLKVQLSPSLKKRPPYFVTSFEKVPGTVVGNALPDILADIGDAGNAALRALCNNMSIASGPQVVVNEDRLADNESGDDLFPWKRWRVVTDPLSNANAVPPIAFFNVDSHAQELLGVYEKFTQIADELSAIPRYITGSERLGGAGRTASGLAMLMGNAAKILQTVAANIDGDVVEPVVSELYDLVMLTDQTGRLRVDESIDVLGVAVAIQRETQRQRQLEFLQITGNPIDMQITGPQGRATVLRAVADGLGLKGEDIVPPDDVLQAQMQQAAMMGQQAPPGGASPGGGGPGPSGGAPPQGAAPPGAGGAPPRAPPAPKAPKPGAQPQTALMGAARPGGAA